MKHEKNAGPLLVARGVNLKPKASSGKMRKWIERKNVLENLIKTNPERTEFLTELQEVILQIKQNT